MKRPTLSILASSADAIVQQGLIVAATRAKKVRKPEADRLIDHMVHIRDLVAVAAMHPDVIRGLLAGVQYAPVTAISAAARQIAEEGGE